MGPLCPRVSSHVPLLKLQILSIRGGTWEVYSMRARPNLGLRLAPIKFHHPPGFREQRPRFVIGLRAVSQTPTLTPAL